MVALAKRKHLALLLLIIGVSSISYTFFSLFNSFLPDFSVYYYSTKNAVLGINPYLDQNTYTLLTYPPFTLVFFIPFLILSFGLASKLWLVVSLSSFILGLYFLYKAKPIDKTLFWIIFALTAFSFPFKFTLGMGQVNLVLFFLISLTLYSLTKKTNIGASISLAVSVALKLIPLFFLVVLLVRGQFKALVFSTIFTVGIIFFSILVFGKEIHIYYLNELVPRLSQNGGDVYFNQSITGLFAREGLSGDLIHPIRVLLLLLTLFCILKRKDLFYAFSLMISFILLTNSFSWQHHLVLLILPFYLLLSEVKDKYKIVVLLSYLLVALNFKNPEAINFSLLLSHGFFGILLIFIMLLLRVKK